MTFEEMKKLLDAKDTGSGLLRDAIKADPSYVYDPKNPPKGLSEKEKREQMRRLVDEMKSEKGYSKGGLVKGFKGTF
jgi:hypothetical protein